MKQQHSNKTKQNNYQYKTKHKENELATKIMKENKQYIKELASKNNTNHKTEYDRQVKTRTRNK